MQNLVFSYTHDLPHLQEAHKVRQAAGVAGYALDVRHAHAVVEAWRLAKGKKFNTDDGDELSVPPMPLKGEPFVSFLLSVCNVPKISDPKTSGDGRHFEPMSIDIGAWWTWAVGQHTPGISPFEQLAKSSVTGQHDTPKAWGLVFHLIDNPPTRKLFELAIRAVMSAPTADALVDALWPTQRTA